MNYSKKFLEQVLSVLESDMNNTSYGEILASFGGFGDLLSLEENEIKEYASRLSKVFKLPSESIFQELKSSSLSSFYTPNSIISAILKHIHTGNGTRILDPAMGSGRFVAELLYHAGGGVNIYGVEKDTTIGNLVKQQYQDNEKVQIEIGGYQNFEPPGRKFDVITTNIPFGNYKVFDKAKKKGYKSIERMYLMKSIDLLSDNGLMALVVPRGILDNPNNEDLREELVTHCDLISAIRLPNNTFQEGTKTKVVSDILVMQRNPHKQSKSADESLFVKTLPVLTSNEGQNLYLNAYLKKYQSSRVLGNIGIGVFHQRENLTVNPNGIDVAEHVDGLLNGDLSALRSKVDLVDVKRVIAMNLEARTSFDEFRKALKVHQVEVYVKGSGDQSKIHFIYSDAKGEIFRKSPEDFGYRRSLAFIKQYFPSILESSRKDRINAIKEIKDDRSGKAADLIQFDLFGNHVVVGQAAEKTIEESIALPAPGISKKDLLNDIVKDYDLLRLQIGGFEDERKRLKDNIISYENRFGQFSSKSNSKYFNEQFSEHAFLLKELTRDSDIAQAIESKPRGIIEAFNECLIRKGRVEVELIHQLSGKSEDEISKELIARGKVFEDLGKRGQLILADEFLSGNVGEKIKIIKLLSKEGNINPLEAKRQVKLLTEILPKPLSIEQIHVQFGVRWLDAELYSKYLKEVHGLDVDVRYSSSLDTYKAVVSATTYDRVNSIWKVGRAYNVNKVIEAALHNVYPTLNKTVYENGKETKKMDKAASRELKNKIEVLRNDWIKYTKKDARISKLIESRYNELFNQNVPRAYHNALSLEHVQHFKPYDHQRMAVWKGIQNLGGLLHHDVGSGKTLTKIMIAIESKRMGLIHKPMITALKANYEEIGATVSLAYPNAKVLIPKNKDFTPEGRKTILGKMMVNDYDLIVVSHEQFGKIPQDYSIQKKIINEKLSALDKEMQALYRSMEDVSKQARKGLEKRKLNYEAKLDALSVSMKKDRGVPNFSELGIDLLLVDESQQFKNLEFTTRHQNVAGLGNPLGSQRAFNMEIASRVLHEKHGGDIKGLIFSSGTPISNSITELYNINRYMIPEEMKKRGMEYFDGFASNYAIKSLDYELNIAGDIKKRERFRAFANVPELVDLYNSYSDVRNKLNLKLDKPEVNRQLVLVKPSEEQIEFNLKLLDLAHAQSEDEITNALFNIYGTIKGKGHGDAKMLIATTLARKNSLDLRLVDEQRYIDHVSPKLKACSEKVVELYHRYDSVKGTQLIFSDLGTPKHNSYSTYQQLKEILVDGGVLPDHIAFIHDYKTERKKEELFKQVNAGQVRVLMGSTVKMGTGTNVQQRAVAAHHLDIPWRPSDLEQRDGRHGRQGNQVAKQYLNNEVFSFYYATEKTIDGYQYEIVKLKQEFIDQIASNSIGQRIIEEKDSDQAVGFAEFVAAITGDDSLLKLTKLEVQINELYQQKALFEKNSESTKNKIKQLEFRIPDLEKIKTEKSEMARQLQKRIKDVPLGEYFKGFLVKNAQLDLSIEIKGITHLGQTMKEIQKELSKASAEVGDYQLATLIDHNLSVEKRSQTIVFGNPDIHFSLIDKQNNVSYEVSDFNRVIDGDASVGNKVKHVFNDILQAPYDLVDEIEELKAKQSSLHQNMENNYFAEEEKLKKLEAMKTSLEHEMEQGGKKEVINEKAQEIEK